MKRPGLDPAALRLRECPPGQGRIFLRKNVSRRSSPPHLSRACLTPSFHSSRRRARGGQRYEASSRRPPEPSCAAPSFSSAASAPWVLALYSCSMHALRDDRRQWPHRRGLVRARRVVARARRGGDVGGRRAGRARAALDALPRRGSFGQRRWLGARRLEICRPRSWTSASPTATIYASSRGACPACRRRRCTSALGNDLALVGECLVVALDSREVVEVVDHEAGALSQTLLAGVAHPVEPFEPGAVAEVEAGHRVERLARGVLRVEEIANRAAPRTASRAARARGVPVPVRAIELCERRRQRRLDRPGVPRRADRRQPGAEPGQGRQGDEGVQGRGARA